jgi:serine phosphatase RsbU (regulator of sigma subunit)
LDPEDQRACDRALLLDRTLHWAEMYLRSRDAGEFAEMTRDKFLAQLLAAAYKMLTPVSSGKPSVLRQAGANPTRDFNSSIFIVKTHALPLEHVGGDWVGLKLEDDGSLWIMMADVTGHGSPAHIIANGLPYLWETRSIAQCRAAGYAPSEVLAAIGAALESVLPETVFVEATLVRFSPAGRAWASGAGNCRLILRKSRLDRFDLHHLGGSWLGLGLKRHDQGDWELAGGDEFLLASDGLYEQRDGEGCHLERTLDARAGVHLTSGRSLHDAVIATLDEVLAGARQNDDILVVTVRFQEPLPSDPGTGNAGM